MEDNREKIAEELQEHLLVSNSRKVVPLFLQKLWKMVNDSTTNDIIDWNESGDGFIIRDQIAFMTEYLPAYFKHNNLASFIRQLNFYGFHKSVTLKNQMEFTHNYFVKELPALLQLIKRKPVPIKTKSIDYADSVEMSEVLKSLRQLKNHQSSVQEELKNIKQENAALWSEVSNMRVKYLNQSKVINKLINFLVSYIQSTQGSHLRRKTVEESNEQRKKRGPTILELDSSGSPADIWRKFDESNQQYMVTEPTTSTENLFTTTSNLPSLEHVPTSQISSPAPSQTSYTFTLNEDNELIPVENISIQQQSQPSPTCSTVAVSNKSQDDNLNMLLDNTQLELDSLQDILSQLNHPEIENIFRMYEGAEEIKDPNNKQEAKQELVQAVDDLDIDFDLDTILPQILNEPQT